MARRHRNGRAQKFGEGDGLGRAAAVLDPAAGDDDRPFGVEQHLGGLRHRGCRRRRGELDAAGLRVRQWREGRFGGLYVAGQVQQHRAAPRRKGGAEPGLEQFRDPLDARDRHRRLGHRGQGRVLVDLLECIAIDMRRRQGTGDGDDQRNMRRGRIVARAQLAHRLVGHEQFPLPGTSITGSRSSMALTMVAPLTASSGSPKSRLKSPVHIIEARCPPAEWPEM